MHPTSQQSTRPLPSRCNQDATLYVSLELSHSTWLLTSLSPGSERMSKHSSPAGDGTALLGLLARLRAKAARAVGISDAIDSSGVAADRARIQRLCEQRHRRWD
jgi:transposase